MSPILIMTLAMAVILITILPSITADADHQVQQPASSPFRVIDGEEALKQTDWPFMASLRYQDPKTSPSQEDHHCGASIINDNTLITAGHCLLNDLNHVRDPGELIVYVGELELNPRKPGAVYEVEKVIVHEGYRKGHPPFEPRHPVIDNKKKMDGKADDDIGMIRLRGRLQFGQETNRGRVDRVCLPSSDVEPDPTECRILGWGKWKDSNGRLGIPNRLQQGPVPLHECSDLTYIGAYDNEATKICAGISTFLIWPYSGRYPRTCYADSGGPLICRVKHQPHVWLLYGLVSTGKQDCIKYPFIYTRVSSYLPWILANL